MADFGTTFERLELKYLIGEDEAESIRRFIEPWCEPDDHNGLGVTGGYPIYSLYLDTPDQQFYRQWRRRDADRIKLRVRTYAPGDQLPAFLEIKRKVVDVIAKDRVAVVPSTVPDAIAGFGRPIDDNPEAWSILDRFAQFTAVTGATPSVVVRYEREAFVSQHDRYARVTFDRHIEVQPASELTLQGREDEEWLPVDGAWMFDHVRSPVILELKCETEIPLWLSQVIEMFELRKRGFSKFGYGVEAIYRRDHGVDVMSLEAAPYV